MFHFKQFSIDDSGSAMKIGTDGVLLGAWALQDCHPLHIIDVGAGSGLIALMLAQRFPDAEITAVELDRDAAAQAQQNVTSSPWSNRMTVINCDFMNYRPDKQVDAIVSNPPFFDEPLLSPDSRRAAARHESGLTLERLIERASELLEPGGHLALIAPAHRDSQLVYHSTLNHLDVERITLASSNSCHPPIRVMIEAVSGCAKRFVTDNICIRNNGRYTDKYQHITNDFYLPQTFK